MLYIQIPDLILTDYTVHFMGLRLQINRSIPGTAETGSGRSIFAVITPETRPDNADRRIFRCGEIQPGFGILAQVTKRQIRVLTPYVPS